MDMEMLAEVLKKHTKWLNGEEGGERAVLSDTDLRGADLSGADLMGAVLSGADLMGADLIGADLSGADLMGADLIGADLSDADLMGAVLSGADLSGAVLSDADLRGAVLSDADLMGAVLRDAVLNGADLMGAVLSGAVLSGVSYDERTAFFAMACPEEGAFVGFKKAHGYIVKLLVPDDAKRSSATTRKCRCSKAEVISITNADGSDADRTSIQSDYDHTFVYTVGEVVEVEDFDEDRWKECAPGIHFFITRDEAVRY